MAAPQKENGFTPIANELLEALIAWDGPGRVKDLVFAVMRETYGWSEKERKVDAWRLCGLLHVGERRLRQLRDQAVRCSLLTYSAETGYCIQKNWEEWTVETGPGKPMDEAAKQRIAEGGTSAEPTAERKAGIPQDRLPQDRLPAEEPPSAGPPSAEEAPAEGADTGAAEGGYSAKAEGGPSDPPRTPPRGYKATTKDDTHASAGAEDVAPALPLVADAQPPTRKQRKAMTDDEAEAMIALARADLPPGCLDLVETLMDLFAAENKTGKMALSREAMLTADLADKCKRDGIGTDALRYGLAAAISKGAANVNYVIKAANGWVPGTDRPSSNGKLFITCSDGSKLWEDSPNWGLSQELGVAEAKAEGIWNQRTGCTTVPSRGFCCDDGWYYDSRDDGSMYQARRWGQ